MTRDYLPRKISVNFPKRFGQPGDKTPRPIYKGAVSTEFSQETVPFRFYEAPQLKKALLFVRFIIAFQVREQILCI